MKIKTDLNRVKFAIQRRWKFYHERKTLRVVAQKHQQILGNPAQERPAIFILGSGRSGTTLFRSMLHKNPNLVIPPETNFLYPRMVLLRYQMLRQQKPWAWFVEQTLDYGHTLPDFQNWKLDRAKLQAALESLPVEQHTVLDAIRVIFESYVAQEFPGREVTHFVDKTPWLTFYMDFLHALYPQAKFIYLLRDSRDVGLSFKEREKEPIAYLRAVIRWKLALDTWEQNSSGIPAAQRLVLRYEDLVQQPAPTMKAVCQFLDIEFLDEMLDTQRTVKLNDDNLPHHCNIGKPIFTDSIGRWRKLLSPQEIEAANQRTKVQLERYGYAL